MLSCLTRVLKILMQLIALNDFITVPWYKKPGNGCPKMQWKGWMQFLLKWMSTDKYHIAGNTKLHNFITTQTTNYHYINNTINMNTIDNNQSCHNTRIWPRENNTRGKYVPCYSRTHSLVKSNLKKACCVISEVHSLVDLSHNTE